MDKVRQQMIQDNPAVRERLLGEALRLFTEKGYASTSVRELVESAGVTKPVLYYYFGSKEGLYLEIMNGISGLLDQRINELQQAGGTVRQRLLDFFSRLFVGARENIPAVRLAYAIYYGPPQGAPFIDFNRFFDTILVMVGTLVAEGVQNGEFRQVDRSALAWALVGCHSTIMEEQICRQTPRIGHDGLLSAIGLILDGAAAKNSAKELP
ncbi:MAG: TetR/AcrR family transcriptional regulator [Geobacter sp.]|nr:TetR/AcrR family transcriptional regulator [Geobacter sp.]